MCVYPVCPTDEHPEFVSGGVLMSDGGIVTSSQVPVSIFPINTSITLFGKSFALWVSSHGIFVFQTAMVVCVHVLCVCACVCVILSVPLTDSYFL